MSVDPLDVALVTRVATDDHDLHARSQIGLDGIEHRDEIGTDDEHLGLGVVDDVGDLGPGESPVDVDTDGVEQGRSEEHLEMLDRVLVEERDPVLGADACGMQGLGDL